MHTKYLPLLVVVLLAGCHQARAGGSVSPQETPQPSWYTPAQPLQASLWYSELLGDVTLHVSRPAYVAVFMIQPGRGATMIFPRDATDDNYLPDGLGRVNVRWQLWQARGQWMLASRYGWGFAWGLGMVAPGLAPSWGTWYDSRYGWGPSAGYDPGYFGAARGGGMAGSLSGPTYLFMVASGEPLRTDAFLGPGMAYDLRFASFSPLYTMQLIQDDVLTFPEYSNHTTALYVIWPVPVRPRLIYARSFRPHPVTPSRCPAGQVPSPVPGSTACVAARTRPPGVALDTGAVDTAGFRTPPAWRIPSLFSDTARGLPGRGPRVGLPVTPMPVEPAPATPGTPASRGAAAGRDRLTPDEPAPPVKPVEGTASPAHQPDQRATGAPPENGAPAAKPHKAPPKKRTPPSHAKPAPAQKPPPTPPPASQAP